MLGTVSQPLGTSDINISAFVGSQAFSFPKDSQTKLAIASVSGSHRENWGESNMADASPRTETSTDDTDDKNQEVISLDELAYYVPKAYLIYEANAFLNGAALHYFLVALEKLLWI